MFRHRYSFSLAGSSGASERLLPAALDRRAEADRLAIFGNRAPGDVESLLPQHLDELVIGEDTVGILGRDQRLDSALHRFRGSRVAAVVALDAAGEEIFELVEAAVARQIFVRSDPADRRFVHSDGLGDSPQRQRLQLRDAVAEEALLLRHDLARHLDDRPGALVERLHQPVGALQAFVEPRLGLAVLRAGRELVIIAAVDEQARKRGAVELDPPAAAAARDDYV